MAVSTTPQTLVADYRYFVCDMVSNEVLTEIPFYNVNYGRSIREAGQFTGDVAISSDTYNLNLYTNTLPGKTALYVVRNNLCVWGGVIWSRDYDIKNRILSVSANEFPSYLYHRVAWKTWDNKYAATVDVVDGIGHAVLPLESFDFVPNYPIRIDFGLDSLDKHDGYYYIMSDPAPTTTSFYFTGKDSAFLSLSEHDGKEGAATLTVRQDTFEYARDLLQSLNLDFYDLRFPGTEIEPSAEFAQTISSVARASNVATITFPESHDLIVGQRVTIKNSKQTGYDGRQVITSIPSSTTITFANTGDNQSTTAVAGIKKSITKFARSNFIVTLTTSSTHGIEEGDVVTISDVNGSIDGIHTVLSAPTTTTFTLSDERFSSTIAESTSNYGYVTRSPEVRFSTYGEFSQNSGLDIDYSTQELSTQAPRENKIIRGGNLDYVGEILEEYSNVIGGFEYRIDCTYDDATDSFKRQFVFMPLEPNSLTVYRESLVNDKLPAGKWAPISAFGADAIVFEHPGNILNATMQESAEDAATRFWVQGDNDTNIADTDVSLPYSGDSAVDLLRDGWPILEQVEKVDGTSDEDTLFNYASRYLLEARPPLSTFSIVVDGSVRPQIGTYKPGDWCSVIIDDQFVQLRMQSGLETGSDDPARDGILLRKIDSYEVRVPDGPTFPEEVTLNLVTEPEIDKPGASLLQLSVLAKTATSVDFAIVIDLDLEETTTITLYRNSTSIETWDVSVGSIINDTYTATGLTAATEYNFDLIGPGGYLDSVTVTTSEA